MSNISEKRMCQNCKLEFVIEPDDFSFYEKIKVPPPTFCPECRMIRRMTWRNERSLFKRTCDYTGNSIITMFNPDANVKVYDRDIWWSDKWDPTDYGMDYDFSRPFFEQYKELLSKVPLANLGNTNCINSPYGNHDADCKNCYLVYASYLGEDVMYSQGAASLKNSMDTYTVFKSEFCYEDIISGTLYNTHFSYDCDDSLNSFFLKTCVNCNDCICCVNLHNKKYCIFNQQYTKEDYLIKKKEFDFGSYKILSDIKKKYKEFILKFPHKYAALVKTVDSTGDCMINAKNVKQSFDIYGEVEDSKFVAHGLTTKDSYDCYGFGGGAYLLYEGVDTGLKASNVYFSVLTHSCMNTEYTYMCYNSKNLFGCIGVRKGEYCILNKKYTKEEYEKLIPRIIKHMNDMPYVDKNGCIYKYGEFFPSELSPFTYNETIAQEYFPKSKEEIIEQGYTYRKPLSRDYQTTIKSNDLPDHIKDTDESILDEIIACPNNGNELTLCTEAYRITKDELAFLKNHNIALPRFCPNCRHYERLHKRNPLKLWHRKCMHEGCQNEFETSYAPERPEIVYCEQCYQKEVY
ncbi:MAG TPA: hypothetical protein VK153_01065 [Candidatus Paceibacterota bacterium]|nr:hypothetical protein [Candidatus Paceibacterota bacterium]